MKNREKKNKDKLKKLTKDMLKESYQIMLKKVDKVLDTNAVDIEGWSENTNPMILPKIIVTAILQDESRQYEGKGTSFHKQVKKDVENLKMYL
jgi:hypothetical protein